MADPETGDLANLCGTCGRSFKYRRNLYTNQKEHAGTLPFHCCGKSFASRQSLRRHRCSVHGENKQFVCTTCHKEFSTQSGLNEHDRNEKKGQKYSCDICGLKASKYSGLKSHMATHIKKKNGKDALCVLCCVQTFKFLIKAHETKT